MALNSGIEQSLTSKQASYVQLQGDGSINVNAASDYDIEGETWMFRLKLESTVSSIDPGNSIEYDFSIVFIDGCVKDELSNPSSIDDFQYFLGSTGLYPIATPTYTQLLTNCGLEWELVALSGGLEAVLNSK